MNIPAPPERLMPLRRPALIISSLSLLVILTVGPACDFGKHSQRAPNVEIEGDGSWYKGSNEEKEYLLKTFPAEGEKTIPWPPEELRRYVDISVDVTKSSFSSVILYRGKKISWAEYNIRKFSEYLVKEHVLLPGDRITLRIFGSKPNSQEMSQDQSLDIANPPLQVKIKADVYTNRYNDRHLQVAKVWSDTPDGEKETVNTIEEWCLKQIGKEIYTKSPLLNHMANVKRNTDSKKGKRVLIFITDAHIDFENLYFSPAHYSDELVAGIRKGVEELNLKPFDNPDPNVSIIIFGLNYQGDERFRLKQQELLRWFFDKQDPQLVTLIVS
ncbi:MAG: hypothetical protein JOZ96_02845 [Acidobacteria bacterium]|nr:hypothetical protein [Acidobacteriota bacterium]